MTCTVTLIYSRRDYYEIKSNGGSAPVRPATAKARWSCRRQGRMSSDPHARAQLVTDHVLVFCFGKYNRLDRKVG